ncbi:hypothetical protein [Sphingomonas sp. GB1N7]|uniref:hypothetical protein n=1 Tax=Parasphingomonas caseinilytica TaxID=3096158 RepID=UPI002FC650F2
MDKQLDDFFTSSEPIPETETEVETQEVETNEPVETTEAETEVEAVVEAEPKTAEPKMVPLSVVHAERDRAREARDALATANARLAEYEAKQANRSIPDPYDDPTGFAEYQQKFVSQQVAEQIAQQNFHQSRERALTEYGQEFIDELADWGGQVDATDPTFAVRMLAQADPVKWVIEQKKRADMLAELDTDPDAYVRKRAAELGLTTSAVEGLPVAIQPTAPKALGPKSLVAAKSRETASATPTKEDAFDAIFKK